MKTIKCTILCSCFLFFLFMFTDVHADNGISIEIPEIVLEDDASYAIDLIDEEREIGKVAIYTRNYGEFTKPFSNNTQEYIVINNIIAQKNTKGAKGTYIPLNGFVISYTGENNEFTNSLYIGRNVSLQNFDIPVSPDMYFKLENMIIPIDQVNAIRNAGQVILYNPSYGTSTNTNPWGIELTVVDNVITGLADIPDDSNKNAENNSVIPPEGVVISIHSGSPYYKYIHENAKLGSKVVVADDSTKLYSTARMEYAAHNPRTIADNPAAWDAEKGEPYDSFRGPNQIIIYDSSYNETTGTNPYGYEITVNSEGNITAAGGNDSEIPEGGYIISGHGDKLSWLQKYALLGAKVILNTDKKEVIIIMTPESYINRALFSINSAQSSLDQSKNQYLDIPYDKVQEVINNAASMLEEIQAQVNQCRYENLVKSVKEIQNTAETAYFMTFESLKVENRAIWLRPRDTSIDDVRKRLDRLKDLNINIVYLETFWSGYAIYPSGNELMQHNPMFKGFDVLDAYIKEAHSRGIEVHAWVENFLVDLPVASKKPEWMAISRKGDNYYLENGRTKYYFLNPALPEVRDFLSELYKDLIKKYDIDGIQFDYMRYSHSSDYTNDFGYDTYTRQLFKAFTGIDPIDLNPDANMWQEWCSFRTNIISSYAYRIISEIKSINPEIQISADVWPEYDETIVDIYQNPKAWVSKDYIDNIIPMSYYLNEKPVTDDIMNTLAFARGHSQIISGIATYTKVDKAVLVRQIDAIRASNTNGVAIFEYESLFNGGYDTVLKLGVYNAPSVVTYKDPVLAIDTIFEEIIRKIDDIYVKYNGISTEQGEKLKELISQAKINLKDDNTYMQAAYSAKRKVEELLKNVNDQDAVNEEIIKRISSDLNNIINIIDGLISKNRYLSKREVEKFQVELDRKELKESSMSPLRIKAVFNDNTVIYLDSTQYSVSSDDANSAEVSKDMLILKDRSERTEIIVDIMDSLSFNTADGLNKRLLLIVDQNGKVTINDAEYGTLKLIEVNYAGVKLDWGHTLADTSIIGYTIYRDGTAIAKTSETVYKDRDIEPGKTHTYQVRGFDIYGNIIYESNKINVKTKGPVLIAIK